MPESFERQAGILVEQWFGQHLEFPTEQEWVENLAARVFAFWQQGWDAGWACAHDAAHSDLAIKADQVDALRDFLQWASGMPPRVWDQLPDEVRTRWQEILRGEVVHG